MNEEFILALTEIAREKNMPKAELIETIQNALIAAYKKNYGHAQNVIVNIDDQTGEIRVMQQKEVVEEVVDPKVQMTLDEAYAISKKYNIADMVNIEVTPKNFGRIAAQTAKNVVIQKLKEVEKNNLYEEYHDKENQMVTGLIVQIEGQNAIVHINNDTEAILPSNEQILGEAYVINKRMKFYVSEVKMIANNPQIILSRTHPALVKRLFELNVPEIASGTVEIKSIAREAGSRSKISVYSADENVDPVGACVGPKGKRVQDVCDELGGEKIDIITYSDDSAKFISSALSPSDVVSTTIDEESHSASVIVPAHQLSLAIGKEGQNVRLAARLTGWKIDIKPEE